MYIFKKIVPILILFLCTSVFYGQRLDSLQLENETLFTSFEHANTVSADSVYRLSFKRKLPDNFAQKIVQYPHLQELHIRNMRLKKVPDVVWQLKTLTVLNMSNNRLDSLSVGIKKLVYLERLILNRNYIRILPVEISELSHLSYLDLWSNLIITFPEEISKLRHSLKTVDMRVINMGDEYKEILQERLPDTKFLSSRTCDCKSR